MMAEGSRSLLQIEYKKLERTLMCSNSAVPTRKSPTSGAFRVFNEARVDSGSCQFKGPPFLWRNEENWSGTKRVEMEVLTDGLQLER